VSRPANLPGERAETGYPVSFPQWPAGSSLGAFCSCRRSRYWSGRSSIWQFRSHVARFKGYLCTTPDWRFRCRRKKCKPWRTRGAVRVCIWMRQASA